MTLNYIIIVIYTCKGLFPEGSATTLGNARFYNENVLNDFFQSLCFRKLNIKMYKILKLLGKKMMKKALHRFQNYKHKFG